MRPHTATPSPITPPNPHRSQVPATGLGTMVTFDPRILAATVAPPVAARPQEAA
ncbi:hypothetical protein ACVU7I_15300 [Patulibacter sp. S7RM1-6]